MIDPQTSRSYYPALDGLRGLASLLVVVYHNFGFIKKYVFFGWLGTDIFFVLSGFLITDILLNGFGREGFLKRFYARRALRVFPLYYLSLFLFLIILPRVPDLPVRLDYFTTHQAWLWLYAQNWLYVFRDPANQSLLNHLWSLAVEQQFYVLWPLVVLLLRKPGRLLLFISAVLVGVVILRFWMWRNHIPDFAYYNLYTFTRIDGLCVGCMVALLQRISPGFLARWTAPIVLLFAGLNFLFFFFNRAQQFSYPYIGLIGYTTFAMVFGLLVYNIVNRSAPLFTRLLNIAPLRFCGRVSFGCYMFHWPLYLLAGPALRRLSADWLPSVSPDFFASLTATVAAYGLGYLSLRYFEVHFLKLKGKV